MRNKRRLNTRKSNKIFSLIEEHVNKNIKEYVLAVTVFLIGIIIGVMLVNSSNYENQESIKGYINEFISSIENKEFEIDEKKLFIKSMLSNLKIAVIIWIAGSTIIGIPIVYGSLGYKGVCIGYSISAIIATLGKSNGIIFSIGSMLLQNLIAIPCILALSVSSTKMYKATIRERNKENIKFEIYRHTMFSFIMTIGLVLASFVEMILSNRLTSDIIIKFI